MSLNFIFQKTFVLGIAVSVVATVACSSKQDLGSGTSKAGETCAKSSDCVDGLRCLGSKCGGGGVSENASASGVTESCDSDETCALRGGTGPYCKNGGACTECMTDAHCSGRSGSPKCKVTPSAQDQNFCVDCLADADCTDPQSAHCSTGKYGNFCVACLVDADCKDPSRRRCQLTKGAPEDAPFGSCVGCLQNADCKDPTMPICRYTSCEAP